MKTLPDFATDIALALAAHGPVHLRRHRVLYGGARGKPLGPRQPVMNRAAIPR